MIRFLTAGLCLYFLSAFCIESQAQGISTEGKDFWVGYLTNWLQDPGNPVILELYISADDTTSGVVTMPRLAGFNPIEFEVYPNSTKKIQIPSSVAMASGSGTVENKGIHIETDNNVSVYAMNKRQYSADMTVVLPTFSLGNNYFVLSHWEDGNRNNNANSDAEFLILAITDSTEIEIIPTAQTVNGNPAEVPFRISLQKGQTYQLRAKGDLTGTQITATNNSDCRNFAVFSGNMYTQVGECNVENGHDHLYAQMYPTNTLGKNFIIVPLENRFGGDIIKFLATQDETSIRANDETYQLDKGEFVKILSASVLKVTSDKPIAVGQYSRTMDCDGTLGDPFLIPISPNEQMLKKITFNAPSIATLSRYSLNIIVKNEGVSEITFDGTNISGRFTSIPESEYAFARINTSGGNHTIRSNSGFIAYVYGFGQNESFGYATGASLGNLNIDFTIHDKNVATPIDSLCLGNEITFMPATDRIFTQFEYDFGDGTKLFTDKDTAVVHKYNSVGEYQVSFKASTGGNDCSNGNQETSVKIIRIIEPQTQIFGPRSVCPNTSDVAYFIKDYLPNKYSWFVHGGDFSQQTQDSVLINWKGTNSEANVQLLAKNRYGCTSDTIAYPVRINIQLDPEAPFGPDTLCSDNIMNIPYDTYFTESSEYTWSSDFASIKNGNGTNKISVDWNGYGEGNLWFTQHSVTDTVCDGTSDSLQVYIQRNPSEYGKIVLQKDTFYLGETMTIDIRADTLFRFVNWAFDDGTARDTVDAFKEISYSFECPGLHSFSAILYDTGTICAETNALLYKKIYVLPPHLEIIRVTNSAVTYGALDIEWQLINGNFYTKKLYLYRTVAGDEQWRLIASLDPDISTFTDQDVQPDAYSYEYKIVTNAECADETQSQIHQSILLTTEKQDSTAILFWNNYVDWQSGVDHYEIWVSIDSGQYQLLQTVSDLYFTYSDQNTGFEHCFEVRAVEKGGNQSSSLSNSSCASFVPEIKTYNIITPNNDKYNEYFTIDNIEFYPNSVLTIINRWGEIIYEKTGYNNDWNGKTDGKPAVSATYYYQLNLNEPRNEVKSIKGWFSILY